METAELYRGRLVDHIQLVVPDLGKAQKFYEAVFAVLGIPMGGTGEGFFWADELFISDLSTPASGGKLTGPTHLAFQARDRAMVDRFYEQGLAAGATSNGEPGERPYHPGYYAAFLIDPAGNNIEAVFHGPAKKSAESIKITF